MVDIKMSELRIVEKELGLSVDVLLEAVQDAMLHVYMDTPGHIKDARVQIDPTSGEVRVWAPEVDENGTVIGEFDDTPKDFGRIATMKARSIISQRIRDAEADRLLGNFKGRQGQLVSGIVVGRAGKFGESKDLVIRVGDQDAYLRASEQVPTEHFEHGDHIRALVLDVTVGARGASVHLSRTHPDFVRQLFELEVPELQDGTITIEALAREAGHRTKLAVSAADPNMNAKGTAIGHNGQRVRAVTQELNGEKIDIVDYSEDPATFIASALSPARVLRVDILDRDKRLSRAVVPDNQTSLAIGKEAQNVRLAAKLTGWGIDIRGESELSDAPEADAN
ncbi:MAG: transcription termination factor NusA [Actinomycetaceae bacterium]|nr:transcription termination factor NusA [Actinomycetaceae bacterium]MDY6082994.1 transcription termination factor NusA [Actinomycetaceae bacterium]